MWFLLSSQSYEGSGVQGGILNPPKCNSPKSIRTPHCIHLLTPPSSLIFLTLDDTLKPYPWHCRWEISNIHSLSRMNLTGPFLSDSGYQFMKQNVALLWREEVKTESNERSLYLTLWNRNWGTRERCELWRNVGVNGVSLDPQNPQDTGCVEREQRKSGKAIS